MYKGGIYKYLLVTVMLVAIISNLNGCGTGKKESQMDEEGEFVAGLTEDLVEVGNVELPEEATGDETIEGVTDTIFYLSSEEYYYLLEGRWKVVEYVGTIRESHCPEATAEGYQEDLQEFINQVIEENLGEEFNIEKNNLECVAPYADLTIVMEDDHRLFFETRFIPGDYISLTPPYIGLSARLIDRGEKYRFIIDAEGTVLIEIDYCYFRLEKTDLEPEEFYFDEDIITNYNDSLELFEIPSDISRETVVESYSQNFPMELQEVLLYCNNDVEEK